MGWVGGPAVCIWYLIIVSVWWWCGDGDRVSIYLLLYISSIHMTDSLKLSLFELNRPLGFWLIKSWMFWTLKSNKTTSILFTVAIAVGELPAAAWPFPLHTPSRVPSRLQCDKCSSTKIFCRWLIGLWGCAETPHTLSSLWIIEMGLFSSWASYYSTFVQWSLCDQKMDGHQEIEKLEKESILDGTNSRIPAVGAGVFGSSRSCIRLPFASWWRCWCPKSVGTWLGSAGTSSLTSLAKLSLSSRQPPETQGGRLGRTNHIAKRMFVVLLHWRWITMSKCTKHRNSLLLGFGKSWWLHSRPPQQKLSGVFGRANSLLLLYW